MENPSPNVEQLLESVGLPPTFLDDLYADSDWSLVIKLNALFEAVLGTLIVRRLGTPEAEDVVANLDFNNVKSGKVAYARALDLLDKQHVSFLRGLCELRNQLAHKVHNVGFTFKNHLAKLKASDSKKFKTEFGYAVCQLENGDAEYIALVEKNPKAVVLLAAYDCLLNLQFRITGHTRKLLVEALLQRKEHAV